MPFGCQLVTEPGAVPATLSKPEPDTAQCPSTNIRSSHRLIDLR